MKIKSEKIASFWKKKERTEDGNAIDLMAGVFSMVMIFATILAMLAYGSLVEKRLNINNTIKNYLYLAEQQGGLKSKDVQDLEIILGKYGCSNIDVTINGGKKWIGAAAGNQVPYGDQIDLEVSLTFDNPVYVMLGMKADRSNASWFKVGGLKEKITYNKKMSSTSRW